MNLFGSIGTGAYSSATQPNASTLYGGAPYRAPTADPTAKPITPGATSAGITVGTNSNGSPDIGPYSYRAPTATPAPSGASSAGAYNPNVTYDPGTNFEGSGMSQAAYEALYGNGNQQGAAEASASAAADAAGHNAVNNPAVNPNLPNSTVSGGGTSGQTGVLSGPGYGEQWYQLYGNDINQPTNMQKLFDQGPGVGNPLYDNAIDMTNRQINAQTAARGIYDSSAAVGSIGLADAALRGQQVKDYEGMGQAADTANTSAYTAGSNAATQAQNDTTNRVNAIVGGQTNLSTAQANTISNFYDMAEKGQLTADMASIEAQIQASGVDAATAQAITNDLLQMGGLAAKAGSGGK